MEDILFIRLSSGGDVVQTFPALALLRQHRPASRITFLVEDRFAPFVMGRPEIDRLWIWPRKRWTATAWRGAFRSAARELEGFYREFRKHPFHWVLDFQGNLKSGVHARLARGARRVGFDQLGSKEGNRLFTDIHVPSENETGPRVRKYADLLGAMGIAGEIHPVPPATGAVDAFRRAFSEQVLPPGGFAVFHPGTSAFGIYKRWPLENWRELARRVGATLPVLISLGPGEEGLGDVFAGLRGVVPRTGVLSPAQLGGALSQARVFVGSDSAPMHFASVLGCPTIALFGPTDPALYAPVFGGRAVRAGLSCSPCTRRTCPDPACMRAVAVDAVYRAASEEGGF